MQTELVVDAGDAVGESPVWLEDMSRARADGVLYGLQCRHALQPLVTGLIVPDSLAGGPFALRPGVRGLAEPACVPFPPN